MNSGKIVLGLLAGVAIGATLGILLAPDKGSSTRKKIVSKKDAYAEELGDTFHDFVNSISKKFQNVKEEANRMAQNGKTMLEEIEKDGQAGRKYTKPQA
jgi:gas vesicle protein